MAFFVLHYRRGPNWLEGKPVREQPLREHITYLHGIFGSSMLVAGGPFKEAEGGLAIVRAGSLAEARAIADADPGVRLGVLEVDVDEWLPIEWSRLADQGLVFANGAATVTFSA